MSGPSEFWRFVYERYRNVRTGKLNGSIMNKCMFQDFEAFTGIKLTETKRSQFLKKIHLTDLSDFEKVELYHAAAVPIDEDSLNQLEDKMTTLEVDESGCLVEYTWKNQPEVRKSERKRQHSTRVTFQSAEDEPSARTPNKKRDLRMLRSASVAVTPARGRGRTPKIKSSKVVEEPSSSSSSSSVIADIPEVESSVSVSLGEEGKVASFDDSVDRLRLRPIKTRAFSVGPTYFRPEEDRKIWEFIIKETLTSDSPIKLRDVRHRWVKFAESATNLQRTSQSYSRRFNETLSSKIHLTDFDLHTKMHLYWSIEAPVDPEFLAEARKTYDVTVDKEGHVLIYSLKGSQPQHQSENQNQDQNQQIEENTDDDDDWRVRRNLFTDQDDKEMWNFIRKKARDPITSKIVKYRINEETWKEYRNTQKNPKGWLSYHQRFLGKSVTKLLSLNLNNFTKLQLYWSLEIPIEESFLKQMRKIYYIKLTNVGFVEYFSRLNSDKNVHLEKSGEQMWEFILEKSRDMNGILTPSLLNLNDMTFWQEYQSRYQMDKTPAELRTYYETELLSKLAEMRMNMKTKLEVYYVLQLPIDQQFLISARKTAFIRCSGRGIIQKYTIVKEEVKEEEEPVADDDDEEEDEEEGCSSGIPQREEKLPTLLNVTDKPVGINAKKYLGALKEFLKVMDSSELTDCKRMVENAMRRVDRNKTIPTENVRQMLKNAAKLP